MQWKELFPIYLTCVIWQQQFSGKHLLLHCDNKAVVNIWSVSLRASPTVSVELNFPVELNLTLPYFLVSLLGQPPEITNNQPITKVIEGVVPISTVDFNIEELWKCIKSFKNNKAAGVDNIPIEVWKSGALELPLLNVCNKVLNDERPTVAHKCQGKTFFPKTKLSFPRQNFLSKDKTFFLKAKLSFPRQNFLSQDKTFFPKTKLSSPRQNFLSQGKTFFSKTKLFSQDKTFFLKAKLSFPRQNSFLKTKLFSQYKTFFPKAKLSYSRQNFLSQGKFSFSRQNFFLKAKLSAPAFFHTGACVVANVST